MSENSSLLDAMAEVIAEGTGKDLPSVDIARLVVKAMRRPAYGIRSAAEGVFMNGGNGWRIEGSDWDQIMDAIVYDGTCPDCGMPVEEMKQSFGPTLVFYRHTDSCPRTNLNRT